MDTTEGDNLRVKIREKLYKLKLLIKQKKQHAILFYFVNKYTRIFLKMNFKFETSRLIQTQKYSRLSFN